MHTVPQGCTGNSAHGCVTLFSFYSRAIQRGQEALQHDADDRTILKSQLGSCYKRGENKENLIQISNFPGSELR